MKPNAFNKASKKRKRKTSKRKTSKHKGKRKNTTKWNYGGKTVGGKADDKADKQTKSKKEEYDAAIGEALKNLEKIGNSLTDTAHGALKNRNKETKTQTSGFTDSSGYRESFASEYMDSGSGVIRGATITPRQVSEAFSL